MNYIWMYLRLLQKNGLGKVLICIAIIKCEVERLSIYLFAFQLFCDLSIYIHY